MYTYPLKASLPFGNYIFSKYYFLNVALFYITRPIDLIEVTFQNSGFGRLSGLLLFLILFAGVVKNPRVPYFIRYNACQALLLKIALIIIIYVLSIFSLPLVELGTFIFVISLSLFIYSFFQCIKGVEPEIPLISESARMQI